LGFKNARFGKIDAHIATCAFAREVLKKATAIAEAQGFKLVHGIVDSMWLQKKDATDSEYQELRKQIEQKLHLPISFEGRYKWIVFLNSRVDPRIPVLNRYYGVFSNGKLKVRGIDLRRHDTAEIIRKCQSDMLSVLSQANNSHEFRTLIPKALAVMKHYVLLLRTGTVPTGQLIITKRVSKAPEEYSNLVEQAIAATHLVNEGGSIHAGQTVNYVITHNKSRISQNRSLPAEFVDGSTHYDSERYVELLLSSATNLLLPFQADIEALRRHVQT
jgi:DNA polymerase elongation subunit (family B)